MAIEAELLTQNNSRSDQILQELKLQSYQRIDKIFGYLLVLEWLSGIVVALFVSPLTYIGRQSSVHLHLITAIVLGGLIISRPLWLIIKEPGKTQTRQTIALAQMLYSALLIHLTGGRVETHFHIFGSLAFLSFYRDWRVLITASLVVTIDHIVRGIVYPESIYGVATIQPWRWVEHVWWVVFEDIFLFTAIHSTTKELTAIAQRQSELETTRAHVEELVALKTRELRQRKHQITTQYAVTKLLFEAKTFRSIAHLLLARLVNAIVPKDLAFAALITEFETNTLDLGNPNPEEAHGFVVAEIHSDALNKPLKERPKLVKIYTLPITIKGKVFMQIDFYCEKIISIAQDQLSMLNSLGQQIGDYLVRTRTATLNQNLLNVVQSSTDAIIGASLGGKITSWNKGAERLFGYSAEELKGCSVDLLEPKNPPLTALSKPFLNGNTDNPAIDTKLVTKSGAIIDVALTVDRVLNSTGQRTGTSFIIHNITERKLAESRVSEFYSVVSHELRTPLTSIRGALGLLENDIVTLDSSEGKEFIEVARESTDRLIRLINEMLDLRKIEAGAMDMYLKDVPVSKLVDDSIHATAGMALKAGVNLIPVLNFDGTVRGDADKLTQILTNLISNAVKFSSPGADVRIKVTSPKQSLINFAVEDFGPGIADDQKDRIFEKFHQIDSSDSREKGGTGLGLAICKAIVEQHSGTIGVTSQPGQGSTFWFELNNDRT
ncbi:MAG: PAS domain S-box protein [Candidatus Obscuribacter sp.]|nr:PAS domain S-box protein [Candidatus Obscuribacter sp.]